MSTCNVLPFFLLSLAIAASVIATESPSRSSSSCHPEQRDALSRFNNSISISGPSSNSSVLTCRNTSYPKTASWREDEDCCSWEGVFCEDSTGDVVGLDLSCARLQGVIDSRSSLFSLRHLRSLNLAGNDFTGTVPPKVSLLSKLVSLNLSSTGLEMQNPTMRILVGNLTEIEELDLSSINMYTVVPASLMNFSSSLISLHLSGCSLGGEFPDYIFQLPNLQQLDLTSNRYLHGALPESNWSSSLSLLSLGNCFFSGEVPHSIGSLPRLTSLDLSGNNFTGYVDFRTFSTLKNLRFLGLSGLSVSGPNATDVNHTFPKLEKLVIYYGKFRNFPCFLSSMPELRVVYLSWSIVNELPGRCANNGLTFPRLQVLEMGFCNLTMFPSFLSHSKRLTHLYLGGNMIKEIPSWFWGIGTDTLEELYLNDNLFKGGGLQLSWKRLTRLHLYNNLFEGPLPIPPAPSIHEFVVSRNRFSGIISSSICQLTSLVSLGLGQNSLTGFIPQCLGNLTDLLVLDLNNNSLTGPLPQSLSNCTSLQTLDVSNNLLGRSPGDVFLRSNSLQFIDLSTNKFEGRLPLPSYATNYYSVSKNRFSGEISSLVCNATNLWILDLSNNGITGMLPRCTNNITVVLEYLNLRVNNFQGFIPEIFPEGSSLKSLDLSRNRLEGSLPRSLSNCKRLEALDVGSNMITDSFPDWLGDLPLKVLSLRSNKFHGHISVSEGIHPFSKVRVLDLSNNSFDNNLPDNLIDVMLGMMLVDDISGGTSGSGAGYMVTSQASYRQQFYSVMINLKGVETEMVKINVQFATLDLSSNLFRGEVPTNIGMLKSLRGLNFSHNGFTGTIPPSVGDLTNLESLDLSSNNLVGGIPRELVKLTSLGALDLSWNNLEGPIPSGGHFDTFLTGSFEGNPKLCGIPLTRVCGQGHMGSQSPLDDGEDDEPGGWSEWKFVAMGFGSGMGIGISLGYIALETGRPLWLARMLIRLETYCSKRSKRKKASRRRYARR